MPEGVRQWVVTAQQLAAAMDGDDRPVVLDLRWELAKPSRREEYLAGHVPGAVFVELEDAFAGPPGPAGRGGRHPMPSVERVQSALRAAGVDGADRLVLCDSGHLLAAARAWWVLRAYGVERIQVLDGGYPAWERAGLPVETGEPAGSAGGDITLAAGHLAILDAEQAAHFASRGLLFDARSARRFAGFDETLDPVAGHIPGARNLPSTQILEGDRLADPATLRDRFAAAGLDAAAAVSCGSGVSACLVALGLAVARLSDRTPVYVGSWSDWVSDRSRPVATGPEPG